MTQKNYYAMYWHYGKNMFTEDGRRIATYVRFYSLTDRDNWVEDGPAYCGESGYRENLPASDPGVRRAIARGDFRPV